MDSEKRKAQKRAANKNWREKNKEHRKEYNKKWREKNKEHIVEYDTTNREKILAVKKKRYSKNMIEWSCMKESKPCKDCRTMVPFLCHGL